MPGRISRNRIHFCHIRKKIALKSDSNFAGRVRKKYKSPSSRTHKWKFPLPNWARKGGKKETRGGHRAENGKGRRQGEAVLFANLIPVRPSYIQGKEEKV